MTLWFNDLTMERSPGQRHGVRLDGETREILLRRAVYLDAADENLVRLAIEGNHTYRQMTRVMRLPSAGGTYRRVRVLMRRLLEPIVAALLDFPADLRSDYREIGIRYFVRRQAVRDIAADLDRPMTDIYRVNAYLRGWCKAMQRAWGESPGNREEMRARGRAVRVGM